MLEDDPTRLDKAWLKSPTRNVLIFVTEQLEHLHSMQFENQNTKVEFQINNFRRILANQCTSHRRPDGDFSHPIIWGTYKSRRFRRDRWGPIPVDIDEIKAGYQDGNRMFDEERREVVSYGRSLIPKVKDTFYTDIIVKVRGKNYTKREDVYQLNHIIIGRMMYLLCEVPPGQRVPKLRNFIEKIGDIDFGEGVHISEILGDPSSIKDISKNLVKKLKSGDCTFYNAIHRNQELWTTCGVSKKKNIFQYETKVERQVDTAITNHNMKSAIEQAQKGIITKNLLLAIKNCRQVIYKLRVLGKDLNTISNETRAYFDI